MYSFRIVKVFLLILVLLLAACGPVMLAGPYVTTSNVEYDATIEVVEFDYVPAKSEVKPNQIKTEGRLWAIFSVSVAEFFTDAVKKEFKASGISINSTTGFQLSGEILECSLYGGIGFYEEVRSEVHYILTDSTGLLVYDSTKVAEFEYKRSTENYPNLGINKVMAENINQVLNDPEFVRAISDGPKGADSRD